LLNAYQLVGHNTASVVTATAQTVVMVIMVWLVAEIDGIELWWGFPMSCLLVLVLQMLFTYVRSRMAHSAVSPLTLIPEKTSGKTFDRSVNYKSDDVYAALNEIDGFLKDSGVDHSVRFEVNLCCEELVTNIASHSTGRVIQHSFDVHINISDEGIYVTIKDAGRPFDPMRAGKMADKNIGSKDNEHLGLRLVTNIIPDITYKYMYGQNTVFLFRKAA
jgi:anti-sigma regulatory factor (Ser/Thr protein kinase)